jgi:hypothetical protein
LDEFLHLHVVLAMRFHLFSEHSHLILLESLYFLDVQRQSIDATFLKEHSHFCWHVAGDFEELALRFA